jgi:hypothetical protein
LVFSVNFSSVLSVFSVILNTPTIYDLDIVMLNCGW